MQALLLLLLALPSFAQVGPGRLLITPANTAIAVSSSQPLTARFSFIGNRTGGDDVSSQVHWQSSNQNIATVSASGMVTATSNRGTVTITATSGPFRGSTTLTVVPAAGLTSVTITPANPSIAKGLTQQFIATGDFSGTSQNITASATWSSSDITVAGIVAPGSAKGLKANSSATITASFSGHSDSTLLNVTAPILQSVVVNPANPTIPLGIGKQFTATGVFSDGSTQDVTSLATWGTTNSSVATVSSVGLATSHAPGSTTISATHMSFTGSTLLTVAPAALASITITPMNPSVHPGTNLQLTATGTFTDGSMQNLTNAVSWSSSNGAVASVNGSGLLSASSAGSVTITATGSGFMGTIITGTTTVSVPALVSIAVTPADPTLAQGDTLQLHATGSYSDASTMDLTNAVTWSSSDANIVSVSGTGLINGKKVGFANISAKQGTITGTTSVLVGFSALSVNGHYAFSFRGVDNDGEFFVAGSFTADGNGHISNGLEDFNGGAGVIPNTAFSGSYTVGIDGRGSATLTTGDTLKFVLTASGNAVILQFDTFATASGTMTLQDAGAFHNLQGNFAFQLSGISTSGAIVDIGTFTADGNGNISNGKDDFNHAGSVGSGTSTGTQTAVNANGRGTLTFHFNDGSTARFSFYIVDNDRANLVSLDVVPAFLGVLHRRSGQTFSNSSLSSFYVFSESGVTSNDNFKNTRVFDAAGVFFANGSGTMSGRQDFNNGGSVTENTSVSANYNVSSSGRGTATVDGFPYVFYVVSPSLAYFMNTDSGAVLSRTIRSQPAVQFSTSSFQGNFNLLLNGEDLINKSVLAMSGQMFADGAGTLTGIEDVNNNGSLSANVDLNGTYSVDVDGRGTGSINGPHGTLTIHFYMVNTDEAVFVETDSNNVQIGSAEVQF